MAGILIARLSSSDRDVWGRVVGVLIGVALVAVSATMTWKTTRNYWARKKTDERHDA